MDPAVRKPPPYSLMFENYDILLCPLNIYNQHWALLIAVFQGQAIYTSYVDSLPAVSSERMASFHWWLRELQLRNGRPVLPITEVTWKRKKPLQWDNYNCGFFVMAFVEEVVRQYRLSPGFYRSPPGSTATYNRSGGS